MPTYLTGAVYDTAFNNAGDPVTLSFNAGSPTNGVIAVDVMWRDTAANTIAGVTFAGNALSGSSLVGSGVIGYRFKRAIGSSGGTQNLVIDPVAPFGTGEGAVTVLVRVYNDCDQTTPSDGFTSATGSDTTLELSVTSPAGDLAVFGGCIRSFGTDMTASSGFTRRLYNAVNGELSSAAADGPGTAGTASIVLTDNGAAGSWLLVGENLNAAAGGGAFTITADPGAYAIAGTAAAVTFGRKLAADPGAYSIAGTDASLEFGRVATADAGAYAITGTAAQLLVGRLIGADPGSVVVTGTAAGFLVTMVAQPGAYLITGTDAELRVSGAFSAEPGAIVITGTDATLRQGRGVTAEPGAFTVAGTDAGQRRSRVVEALPGAYLINGTAAVLSWSGEIPAEPSQTLDSFARSLRHEAAARAHTWVAPRRS